MRFSSQLHQHKGAIYLRSEDGDYRVAGQHQLAGLLNRKLSIFTEQTPMPQFKVEDLRPELFDKARGLMRIRNQNHPWLGFNDAGLLHRAGLLVQDGNHEQPQLTLAAILLFGSDEVIHQAVPGYKFDCLLRRKNTERYDDRLDAELFTRLVRHIREHGYDDCFYHRRIRYFAEAGHVYWTMGEPVEETTIVNRCLDHQTYTYRKEHGTLPP